MIRIYTRKQFVVGKNVIYEPEEFFRSTVLPAVKQGLYELSSEAKALIASEGARKLERDVIETKYGTMNIDNVSWLTKVLIIMEYMHDMCYTDVLNISHDGQHLRKLLEKAEAYGIDVYFNFAYCVESWSNIDIVAQFNDGYEYNLADIVFSVPHDSLYVDGVIAETHIAFSGKDSIYNLFLTSSRVTLKVNNPFLKRKFVDEIREAINNGSITVTGTNSESFADVNIPTQQILFVTRDNVEFVKNKLKSSRLPHIVIYEYSDYVYSALRDDDGCMSSVLHEIVIKNKDEKSYTAELFLDEQCIPACGETPAQFKFTILDDKDYILRRDELRFDSLEL